MGLAFEDEKPFLDRLRQGDPIAYEKLVRSQAGRLLAVAQRILRSEEDARDAVQEAFLHAYEALEGFHGEARLSTWLHRIVVNAALMRLRSRRRRREEPLEPLLPCFREDGHRADPGPAWALPPEAHVEQRELMARVREALDRLPESYRTVLLLRDIEELDTEETALALGIKPDAVKTRLHRARQALRSLLDPHLREALT